MTVRTKTANTRRRHLAHLAGVAALALTGVWSVGVQAAENYPAKPIRIIVPFPAGGGTDMIGRLIGQELSTRWGQSVVVENRSGASGTIGYGMVAKAPADGYTILLGITTLIQAPWLYKNLPYTLSELTPVSQIARSADILMVPSQSGITTLQQFVEKAKANPGALSYASYGNASTSHLNGERFKKEAGIDIVHVPFQGANPAMVAVLGNQVNIGFIDASSASAHLKSDRVNVVGVAGSQRHPALPDVPTVGEQGYPGLGANGFFAVFVPAGTPDAIVNKLGAAVADIVKSPAVHGRLTQMGLIPVGSLPAQFKVQLEKDSLHWKQAVEELGIKLD